MAKDKKSFVLYCDLIHTVRKLPKEDAGELFVHILEYVNDLNPETENALVDIAFEPIKQQLKRDLVKYSERAERARENGKKGGRPITQKTQSVISEPKKPDSVNVNDNVTVNDNEIIPTELQFIQYGHSLAEKLGVPPQELTYSLSVKYFTWKNDGWKDGYGNEIKNWKNKLSNTLPHLQRTKRPNNPDKISV